MQQEALLQFRGTVLDLPPDEIKDGSWSYTKNIFFRDLATQRVPGFESWYNVAGDRPVFAYAVQRKLTALWLVIVQRGANAVAMRWDGSATATDIYTYTGLDALSCDWQATDHNGTIVVNNGVQAPRWWNEAGTAGDQLEELPGWPADVFCRSIRSYKYHLFALGLTTNLSVDSPYEYMWSDASQPGPNSIPQSWTAAPETDAGNSQFASPQGFIVDAIQLRDALLVFKDFSAHLVQFTGGVFVFSQRELYISAGLMNLRCATEYNGKVIAVTQDDVIETDGNSVRSLCTHQVRRYIFGRLNVDQYRYVQIVKRHLYDEVWICYPADEAEYCNEAAIYNTRTGRWGFRPLPNVSCLAYGIINEQNGPTRWEDRQWAWQSDPYRWGERFYSNTSDEIVMCAPETTTGHIYVNNRGWTANGETIEAEATREGVILNDDPSTVKLVTEVWPHILGLAGETIMVQVGGAMIEGESITWSPMKPFVIGGDQQKVDFRVVGRFLAFRFTSTSDPPWRMYNFRVRYETKGRF